MRFLIAESFKSIFQNVGSEILFKILCMYKSPIHVIFLQFQVSPMHSQRSLSLIATDCKVNAVRT